MPVTNRIKEKIKSSFRKGKLEIKSSSKEGEVTYERISNVMRHHVPFKRAFEVITESGKKVSSTEDHSLFEIRADILKEVEPKNLNTGNKIVTIQDQTLIEEAIRVIREVSPYEFMFDLSIPDNENFMLANGILVHNSYSISAVSLDIDKSAKYESLKNNAEGMFNLMVLEYKKSIHITRGLQQPRYGIGLSVHLGPFNKSGIVSPRNYASFNVRGGF